ncbi:HIT family protein [Natronobacterium texcoconense]|uniref:Diadenosine tetraphosphate (Ap4A) hydrolase n=1 Tax=Natronobacterium texcoconense TaxID=1095778 RepID=A0A1H0ZHJ9_NATTX|nr:HIT domain-containing protein [Natronobacterium texcoconense]SDQ26910.1 Diadenosine tetraphosphate (Ap4A) hydrolase [Natronobacterium texcoconense]
MEQVFAPWRIEWIRRDEKNPDIDDCVFCELPELDDERENRLVARNDHAFVLLNNYPYNPGHVMVIPYAHTGEYGELTDEQLLGHAQLKQRTFDALEDSIEPDGFNAGLNLGDGAGGSIDDHLHTHIVPRWQGDTNFMPVLSDTTVIVEALEETYDHLHEAFAEQEGATVPDENSAVVFE